MGILANWNTKIKYEPKKQTFHDQKTVSAIEGSYNKTSTMFKSEAGDAVYLVASLQKRFTSEDVRRHLEARGISTGNWKSLGAIMQSARRAGLIRPSGNFTKSTYKSMNGTPKRVWCSKIYVESK